MALENKLLSAFSEALEAFHIGISNQNSDVLTAYKVSLGFV